MPAVCRLPRVRATRVHVFAVLRRNDHVVVVVMQAGCYRGAWRTTLLVGEVECIMRPDMFPAHSSRDGLDDGVGQAVVDGRVRCELQECLDPIVFGAVLRERSNGIGVREEQCSDVSGSQEVVDDYVMQLLWRFR
eukprot:6199729-Pleurochrysis_carterae.AAC.1